MWRGIRINRTIRRPHKRMTRQIRLAFGNEVRLADREVEARTGADAVNIGVLHLMRRCSIAE